MEELEDFINNINSVLESLYIEIKKGATEDEGRPVYALVSARRRPLVAPVRNCGSGGAPAPAALEPGTRTQPGPASPSSPGSGSLVPLYESSAVIRAGGCHLSAHLPAPA